MRRSTARVLSGFLGLTLAFSVAGCGDDDEPSAQPGAVPTSAAPTPAAAEDITITGIDFGYTLSQPTATTGFNRITFKNAGKDVHMLAIGELLPGKTVTDANTVLKTPDEKDDATVFANLNADEPDVRGTPEILSPGTETTTYVDFKKAGTYALICFFPVAGEKPATPDGPPPFHYERGMLNQLMVTERAGAAVSPPVTVGDATLADGKLTMPAGFTGKGVVKVTSTGKNHHLLLVVKINDGATLATMAAFVDKFFAGEAALADMPGQIWGGLGELDPGETQYWEANLPPGSYFALCTESESDEDAKEHFRTVGEKTPFTVA